MLCYENDSTGERCYVDYMAECQPDPDITSTVVNGLGYGNQCYHLPTMNWQLKGRPDLGGCNLVTDKKCADLGGNSYTYLTDIQCWGDQKGNYCKFL